MTLSDSISAISSPGSGDGRLPCVAQDGPTVALHGQHHAPANLSARQAKALGLLTSGTYGPPHIGLSASAALSWSLASNLAALTRTTGSTLYKLTWKPWAMPSGRLRFRLRASAHRTSETVLTGWPTPTASNTKNAYQDAEKVIARKLAGRQSNLQDIACLAGWPTPTTIDNNQVAGQGAAANAPKRGTTLGGAVRLAAWPTPTATDGRQGRLSGRQDAQREAINGQAGCGGADSGASQVNGFWRDADWLYCRDGKWRPVRPGSFPLANGVPARVGRLRTYGNAINIEAAAAFIKSYMAAVDHV